MEGLQLSGPDEGSEAFKGPVRYLEGTPVRDPKASLKF